MQRQLLTIGAVALFIAALFTSQVRGAGPGEVVIPLSEIWANYMPGTRDIHSLEPEAVGDSTTATPVDREKPKREPYLNQIASAIQNAHIDQPETGFAVSGEGREALRKAYKVIVKDTKPKPSFRLGEELSLVFFSRPAGSRVQLQWVVRRGNSIEVSYRFYSDGLTTMTSHIALIPLGKLPTGRYDVKFMQLPMAASESGVGGERMEDWEQQLICRPFSFAVEPPAAE